MIDAPLTVSDSRSDSRQRPHGPRNETRRANCPIHARSTRRPDPAPHVQRPFVRPNHTSRAGRIMAEATPGITTRLSTIGRVGRSACGAREPTSRTSRSAGKYPLFVPSLDEDGNLKAGVMVPEAAARSPRWARPYATLRAKYLQRLAVVSLQVRAFHRRRREILPPVARRYRLALIREPFALVRHLQEQQEGELLEVSQPSYPSAAIPVRAAGTSAVVLRITTCARPRVLRPQSHDLSRDRP